MAWMQWSALQQASTAGEPQLLLMLIELILSPTMYHTYCPAAAFYHLPTSILKLNLDVNKCYYIYLGHDHYQYGLYDLWYYCMLVAV